MLRKTKHKDDWSVEKLGSEIPKVRQLQKNVIISYFASKKTWFPLLNYSLLIGLLGFIISFLGYIPVLNYMLYAETPNIYFIFLFFILYYVFSTFFMKGVFLLQDILTEQKFTAYAMTHHHDFFLVTVNKKYIGRSISHDKNAFYAAFAPLWAYHIQTLQAEIHDERKVKYSFFSPNMPIILENHINNNAQLPTEIQLTRIVNPIILKKTTRYISFMFWDPDLCRVVKTKLNRRNTGYEQIELYLDIESTNPKVNLTVLKKLLKHSTH